ncbi:MAG: septum formation initiator family protein [Amoebophilaceae bacterium]|nr:septum formation initiator family protein [Amoebophilaceae bacterium]
MMSQVHTIQRIKQLLLNTYVISTVFFVIWMVFFDCQSIYVQYKIYAQLQQLKKEHAYYATQIQQLKKEKKGLLHSQERLEKFAREKYYMKREKEDLYIIIRE